MRFIRVESIQDPVPANMLDPGPYLRELPTLEVQLPAGARAFATDLDHYDFASVRCVKDLRIGQLMVSEMGHANLGIELVMEPNPFKHLSGLTFRYRGVTDFSIDVSPSALNERVWPDSRRLGDFQLDEILPHEQGCSHEIKMTGGTVVIICEDLQAEWGTVGPE